MSCDEKRVPLPRAYEPFSPEQQRVIDHIAERIAALEGVHHPPIVRHR